MLFLSRKMLDSKTVLLATLTAIAPPPKYSVYRCKKDQSSNTHRKRVVDFRSTSVTKIFSLLLNIACFAIHHVYAVDVDVLFIYYERKARPLCQPDLITLRYNSLLRFFARKLATTSSSFQLCLESR